MKPACADHERLFRESLCDDLNAPGAMAAVWDCLKEEKLPPGARGAMLNIAENVFGLGLFDEESAELPADVDALIQEREKARRGKDFALSDKLRRELEDRGILVEDTKHGQKWRRK